MTGRTHTEEDMATARTWADLKESRLPSVPRNKPLPMHSICDTSGSGSVVSKFFLNRDYLMFFLSVSFLKHGEL